MNPSAAATGTANAEDWCRQRLANLQIADRRLDTLAEIRDHLATQPSSSNWLTLPDIFNCIADDGGNGHVQQTTLACEILDICMSNLSIGGELLDRRQNLLKCLQHSSADVRLLGVREAERIDASTPLQIDSGIAVALIGCLQHDGETTASLPAGSLLARVLGGGRLLGDAAVRANLLQAVGDRQSVTVRCRVYELAVNIARQSPDDLRSVEFIVGALNGELELSFEEANGDVLLQLNLLDLCGDLAQCEHGIVYLERSGVIEQLTRVVGTLSANPLRDFLVPGCMRFFGALATIHPRRLIDDCPAMMAALFDCLAAMDDGKAVPVALDTLGHLAGTAEGAVLLDKKYAAELRTTLAALGERMNNMPSVWQVRALGCLREMFAFEAGTVDERVTTITSTWFGWLSGGRDDLGILHDFCRKPFPDMKLAAVTLVAAICAHRWGQEAMARTAGFVEFLLDRHVDFDKDVKQEKYALLRRLAAAENCFAPHISEQLRQYVAEGAFYVSGVMDVAVEET